MSPRLVRRDAQRRADLQDVAVAAARADEHAALGHLVLHPRRQVAGRLARARDPGRARRRSSGLARARRRSPDGATARARSVRSKLVAHGSGVRNEALVLEHVEDRERRRARDRVAAEGARRTSSRAPNRSTMSARVMTAATGWPLPIGLPSVTMSGTTPQREKPHSSPVRPWPDCTSSATNSAPASRAAATISATTAGSGTKMPSAVNVESTNSAAGRRPRSRQPRHRRDDLGATHRGRIGRIGVCGRGRCRVPDRPRRARAARRVATPRWRSRRSASVTPW